MRALSEVDIADLLSERLELPRWLHVTIARLRRIALEGALLHVDDGYFLDPKQETPLAEVTESA